MWEAFDLLDIFRRVPDDSSVYPDSPPQAQDFAPDFLAAMASEAEKLQQLQLPSLPEGNLQPKQMVQYIGARVEALFGAKSIEANAVQEQLQIDLAQLANYLGRARGSRATGADGLSNQDLRHSSLVHGQRC